MASGFQYSPQKEFVALVLELFFFPLRWFVPRGSGSDINRILIVEPYCLGDVANLAVMFDPLKTRFPGCEIHLLISGKFADLFASDPRVSVIHACDIPWAAYEHKYEVGRYSFKAFFRLFRGLRKCRFDIGFDARGEVRNQLLLLLAGCRRRVGSVNYLGSNINLRGWLLTDSIGNFVPGHITRHHLLLCEQAGCKVSAELRFPVLKPDPIWLEGSSGKILVHTGGGSKFKKWRMDHWIGLCRRLDGIVLVGAPNEAERLRSIASSVGSPVDVRITSSLQELMQVLYEARIFVGLDSGPANIASLLGRPCVVLFGPGVVEMYRPMSPKSVALHHQDAYPCAPCSQQSCEHPEATCTESISVEEVVQAVDAILRKK